MMKICRAMFNAGDVSVTSYVILSYISNIFITRQKVDCCYFVKQNSRKLFNTGCSAYWHSVNNKTNLYPTLTIDVIARLYMLASVLTAPFCSSLHIFTQADNSASVSGGTTLNPSAFGGIRGNSPSKQWLFWDVLASFGTIK